MVRDATIVDIILLAGLAGIMADITTVVIIQVFTLLGPCFQSLNKN